MSRSWFFLLVVVSAACANKVTSSTPPACELECQDGIALRALRETTKLAYNLTLQGKPVGAHDETTPCPLGGSVRVFGTATSNAVQGSTEVDLTYVLADCAYLFKDDDPKGTYKMKIAGTLTQKGIIAVQPSATSALVMHGDSISLTGTVYDPPIDYAATTCPIDLGQNGNALSGTLCGRTVNVDL